MPFINPEDGYLTVVNLFKTDTSERVDTLIGNMKRIVDAAGYPGWISSTVHRGQDKLGTLNFIQWRGREDLETRYAGDEFKHHTVPVFREITTYVRLMQAEVELGFQHPSLGGVTEISPGRDDYTVVEVLGVQSADQTDLIAAIGTGHEWLADVPGFRSQSVLRGWRSRTLDANGGDLAVVGAENDFVIVYSQWDGKQSYDAFRTLAEDEQPAARRKTQDKRNAVTTDADWNSYRVAHTRSAHEPATV